MALTRPRQERAARTGQSRRANARSAVRSDLARDLRFAGLVFATHLLAVLAIAGIAVRWFAKMTVVKAVGYQLPPMTGLAHYFLEPLRNWDGFWYTLIAEHGYQAHPATAAFWPLYPELMRGAHWLTGWSTPIVGIILANLAFLPALLALYRLVRLDYGEEVARRTVWLLAFFPTGFYFSTAYTESLFLLLTVGSIYLARTNRWGWAALAGGLAALTRNTGVLVLIPLGLLLVKQYGWDPRRWWRTAARLSVVGLAPLLFLWHLNNVWGDPLLTIHVQKEWARYKAMPWETIRTAIHQVDLTWFWELNAHPTWAMLSSPWLRWKFAESQSYDLFITLLFIPLLVYMLIKVRPAYSLYAAVAFVLPMFSPSQVHALMSVPRFVLVLFPFFIALALLLRRRWLFGIVMALSLIQFAGLLIQFSTWFWVA